MWLLPSVTLLVFFGCVASTPSRSAEPKEDSSTLSVIRIENLEKQGKIKEAEALSQQLIRQLTARKKLPNSEGTTELFAVAGRLSLALRNYSEAIHRLKIAVRDRSYLERQARKGTPLSSRHLAMAYVESRQPKEVSMHLSLSLKLLEQFNRNRSLEAAAVHHVYSDHYRQQGDHDKARQHAEEALSIRSSQSSPDPQELARSYDSLGKISWARGDYKSASINFEAAVITLQKRTLQQKDVLAVFLSNLAAAQVELGEFLEAKKNQLLSSRLREEFFGPDHYQVSISLNSLGNIYRELGDVRSSVDVLQRALEIREKKRGKKDPRLAIVLNNLGLSFVAMGRYEQGASFYIRAAGLLRSLKRPGLSGLGQILINLGKLRLLQGNYASAREVLVDALKISEAARGSMHHEVATGLNFLSLAEIELGRQSEAVSRLTRALRIRRERLGPEHTHTHINRYRLALALEKLGQTLESEVLFRSALKGIIKNGGAENPSSIEPRFLLGTFLLRQGKAAEALRILSRAVYAGEAYLKSFSGRRATAELQKTYRSSVDNAIHAAWEARSSNHQEPNYLSFKLAQAGRHSIAQMSLARMASRSKFADSKLAELLRRKQDLEASWSKQSRRLEALLGTSADDRQGEDQKIRENLHKISKKLKIVARKIARDHPGYTSLSDVVLVSVQDVQAQLHRNEALIVPVHAPRIAQSSISDGMYIWAVTKDDVRWVRADIGTTTLAMMVRALRCGLSREEWSGIAGADRCAKALGVVGKPSEDDPLPFDLDISHKLYEALFGKVRDLIEGKHLLIVPSGPLTSLPFQVLVTEKPTTARPESYERYKNVAWLGARQPITILPSVSSLQSLRQDAKSSAAPKAYLGYGNPILGGNVGCAAVESPESCSTTILAQRSKRGVRNTRNANLDRAFHQGVGRDAVASAVSRLCPLPDTEFEIKCVAQSLGVDAQELRIGAQATEVEIKSRKDLDQYRVLHFATHGLLAGDTQMMARRQGEPALVMTPPSKHKDDDDDGLLTASEITQLKLDADWVILSACNTAGGDKLGAEALSGLARAFFYAGARALLVSHWPVYSDAAVLMTTHAFSVMRTDKTIGRSEAMRKAMIALMQSQTYEDNPHPSVWAPFVVVGEGGVARR